MSTVAAEGIASAAAEGMEQGRTIGEGKGEQTCLTRPVTIGVGGHKFVRCDTPRFW